MKRALFVVATALLCTVSLWADPVVYSAKLSAFSFSTSSNSIALQTSVGNGSFGDFGVDTFTDNGNGTFSISMLLSGNFGPLPMVGLNSVNASGSATGTLPLGLGSTSFSLPVSLVLSLAYIDPACQSGCIVLHSTQTLAAYFSFDLLRYTLPGAPGVFTTIQNAQILYPVPEPTSLILLGSGAVAMWIRKRKLA